MTSDTERVATLQLPKVESRRKVDEVSTLYNVINNTVITTLPTSATQVYNQTTQTQAHDSHTNMPSSARPWGAILPAAANTTSPVIFKQQLRGWQLINPVVSTHSIFWQQIVLNHIFVY